jgi:hypothetical protein
VHPSIFRVPSQPSITNNQGESTGSEFGSSQANNPNPF